MTLNGAKSAGCQEAHKEAIARGGDEIRSQVNGLTKALI